MPQYPSEGLYATEFISSLNIDKPEFLDQLFERHGDQWKNTFKTLQMMGFSSPTTQEEYSHFEDDWYQKPVATAAIIPALSGAGGAPFTIILDPADTLTDTLGGQHIYNLVGDVIEFPDFPTSPSRNIQALVVAVNAAVPSIDVVLLGATSVGPIPSGSLIITPSNAYAEGTGQPKSRIENIIKNTNRVQKIKTNWEGTGTEMTNGKWFDKMSNGKAIHAFWTYGHQVTEYRHMQAMSGALMFNQPTTNNIPDPLSGTGRMVRTTTGWVPWIRTMGGNVMTYPAGFFQMSDFNQAARIMERERAGSFSVFYYGFELGLEFEDMFVNYLSDSYVDYASNEMFGSNSSSSTEAKAKFISIGFKGLQKAGHNFVFKKLDELSNPQLYNAPGFNKAGMGILVPHGKRTAYLDSEKKTMSSVPTYGFRYKALAGYNRMQETFELNGTGHKPGLRIIRAEDVDQLCIRSDIGFQGMCANQHQLWEAI